MLKEVNDLGLVNDLSDYKVSFNQFNKVLGFFIDDTIVGFLDYSVIYDRLEVCKKLIKEYISNKGVLENYHSFNYHLENEELMLNNDIISPYQDIVNA